MSENSSSTTLDGLIAHTLTTLNESDVTQLSNYALYKNTGLQTVTLANVTTLGNYAFQDCTSLTSVSFAKLTSLGSNVFQGCTALTTLSFPLLTSIGSSAFTNCTGLKTVNFSEVTSVGSNAFSGCISLGSVSVPKATSVSSNAFTNCPIRSLALPALTSLSNGISANYGAGEIDITKQVTISSSAFSNCYNLTSLVLRSATMCSLQGTGAFSNTPIASGYGWIYVPADLVATYKAASNWSTYASQIVSISEYPKAINGTITDSWSDIFDAEDDGTYTTKYSVGDTKFVKVNGVPVCMQIVGIDVDELSASGNAKISWLCKGFYQMRNMNPTATTTGGWAACAMRSWLIDSVLDNIQSDVKAQIKQVKKTWRNASGQTETSNDYIWIPSMREIFGGTSYENAGALYTGLFTDATSRIKYPTILTTSANYWWLRSAYSSTGFYSVDNNGTNSDSSADGSYGVVFGFCT